MENLAALGRFVVSFSQLEEAMRMGVVSVAGIGRGTDVVTALQITLAGSTADQTRAVFFATCSALFDLTPDEEAIRNKLQAEVRELIERRNEILHGAWILDDSPDGSGFHTKVAPREPSGVAYRSLDPADLPGLAEQADRLRHLVWAFASGCKPGLPTDWPRVAERLALRDGVVERRF